MQYLIVDTALPDPRSEVWSSTIDKATRFASPKQAEAWKRVVIGATGVIEQNGGWYVVKERNERS
jgi:hypothetical protein